MISKKMEILFYLYFNFVSDHSSLTRMFAILLKFENFGKYFSIMKKCQRKA